MDVRLEPITQENIGALLALRETGRDAGPAEALALAAATPGAKALAITAGGEPVGLLIHRFDAADGDWELRQLVIGAPHRRRGYGRQALQQLIARPPTTATRQLRAAHRADNEPARGFWRALGAESAPAAADQLTATLRLPPPAGNPLGAAPQISLRPITLENARACLDLSVAPGQERFVASNAASLVQSKFEPHWRTEGIYRAETMVGFLMYGRDPDFGWGVLRLMVDAACQGLGYGRAAMELALAEMRAAGATEIGVGYEDDNQIARRLYQKLGFAETGDQPFGQPFAVLALPAAARGEP